MLGNTLGATKIQRHHPSPKRKKKKNLSPLGVYCITSLAERNVFAKLCSRNGKNGCIFTTMDVYLSME
jgi:hypothetical protein